MRIIKWLIGAIVLAGFSLILAPLTIRWYLMSELEAVSSQARISQIGFNIFTGEISFYDVQIRTVDGDEFSVFSATFKLDMLALLERRILIERAVINTAHIDARREGDRWIVAGFGRALSGPKYEGDVTVEIYGVTILNSEICRGAQAQCLRVEEGYLNRVNVSRKANEWSFMHSGRVRMVKTFLRERTSNATLFYVGELNIETGRYAPNSFDLKGLQFQNVQFIQSELDKNGADASYQTQVGDLLVSSIRWSRVGEMDSLDLGPIAATSVRQSLQKNAQSELVLPIRVRLWAKRFARKFAENTLHLTLAEVNALDCAFAWKDQSVVPPAEAHVASLNLKLGSIDSAKAALPTTFRVAGKVSATGNLMFEGEVYPFLRPSHFSISGVVESLGIDSLSGYTPALLDRRVEKGEVDFTMKATADKGFVKSTSRWQWTNFVFESARAGSRAKGSGGTAMPVQTAYDILKDHNDSIRFDLDVNADTAKKTPDLRTVVANQLRVTLTKLARGQVGGAGEVSSVISATGDQKLVLAPLTYAVNASYLGETEFVRLTEIAAVLVGKPHLKMTFCPVMTGGEWLAKFYPRGEPPARELPVSLAQEQSLMELGTARGRTLFSALLEAGVGVDQIVICNPRLDMNQSGMSYISITL